MRRIVLFAFVLALAVPVPGRAAHSTLVVRQVGRLTIRADQTLAYPGGLVSVQLQSRRAIGGVIYAILDGRRCPFFYRGGTFTALVPIPVHVRRRDRSRSGWRSAADAGGSASRCPSRSRPAATASARS